MNLIGTAACVAMVIVILFAFALCRAAAAGDRMLANHETENEDALD